MLSSLVRRDVCPNFILTESVFSCSHPPPKDEWGWDENKKPRGDQYSEAVHGTLGTNLDPDNEGNGHFQYIRMELCDGGDLESFIRDQTDESLPLNEAIIPYMFQMVFAMYAARDKYSLRHFDIKLLNFFLKKIVQPGNEASEGIIEITYGFGSDVYQLCLPPAFAYWVKLADYGTAETDEASLGSKIALEQVSNRDCLVPESNLVVYNVGEYADRLFHSG